LLWEYTLLCWKWATVDKDQMGTVHVVAVQ